MINIMQDRLLIWHGLVIQVVGHHVILAHDFCLPWRMKLAEATYFTYMSCAVRIACQVLMSWTACPCRKWLLPGYSPWQAEAAMSALSHHTTLSSFACQHPFATVCRAFYGHMPITAMLHRTHNTPDVSMLKVQSKHAYMCVSCHEKLGDSAMLQGCVDRPWELCADQCVRAQCWAGSREAQSCLQVQIPAGFAFKSSPAHRCRSPGQLLLTVLYRTCLALHLALFCVFGLLLRAFSQFAQLDDTALHEDPTSTEVCDRDTAG